MTTLRRTIFSLAVPLLATASLALAQTLTVLYSFTGGADGANPYAGVIRDSAGNLYGTTNNGGDLSCNAPYGCGTVFKLDGSGKESVLYSFKGGTDGSYSRGGVIRDSAGNLYGTTTGGGSMSCGCGTVFKLYTSGNETVLYSFKGGTDGEQPLAGVIRDAAGNLYGTTDGGGDITCPFGLGCGTVFKLDTSGNETVLHTFTGGSDGSNPWAGVIQDATGNLYGTTYIGGDTSCSLVDGEIGCGTVFKLDASGTETVLYSFTDGADGALLTGGLIRDATGNLYGTTLQGGDLSCIFGSEIGCGTVFKIDSSGSETTLYAFTGRGDGRVPAAGVIRDAAGNLYGTTEGNGIHGAGTVFKLDATGKITGRYSFTGGAGGEVPVAGLIRDTEGNLYGTTLEGGAYNYGAVFKLRP